MSPPSSNASQSQSAPQPSSSGTEASGTKATSTGARRQKKNRLPGQDLTLKETLRVMDVARELRDQRQNAEEMFQRDDVRAQLRDKLVRTARLSGDEVTEEEIDAAIDQYFESLHTYKEPEGGFDRFIAHCWIWRGRIAAGAAALAAVAGSFWFFFT